MYQALLTRRYLTRKIMPLLAMAAVLLSVATILVTWSVMGGFLLTLLNAGCSLVGDVVITWPNTGFAYSEDLIERLEDRDEIESAAPMVETWGLVRLPNSQVEVVLIKGVDPERFAKVTSFEDSLWWKPITEPTAKDRLLEDPRLRVEDHELLERVLANGKTITRADTRTGEPKPAALLGVELSGLNLRTEGGVYIPTQPVTALPDGTTSASQTFMPRNGSILLTVLALDAEGQPIDSESRELPVANEFQSGVYEADSKTMLVRIETLQQMMNMDEAIKVAAPSADPFAINIDEDGNAIPAQPEVIGVEPARVTSVLVRGVGDPDPKALKAICEAVYAEFESAHRGEVPIPFSIQIRTWEDLNRTMIEAVRKETGLVLFIFGIVCFTNVFLVLSIFWSMVSEKTKDIGILRAIGASRGGIAWLWLRYGAGIGTVGSVGGVLAAWFVVGRINTIHDWIGQAFGPWMSGVLTTISGWFGGDPVTLNLLIWDPRVYYFSEIPSDLDTTKAIVVLVTGVITCVIGAAIPAIRAARMNPVQALRFE